MHPPVYEVIVVHAILCTSLLKTDARTIAKLCEFRAMALRFGMFVLIVGWHSGIQAVTEIQYHATH